MVLPREHRLRGRFVFDHLYQEGVRFHGQWMVLRITPPRDDLLRRDLQGRTSSSCRCAVVISAKVSKRAVDRNRLRRLLHEHLIRSIRALTGQVGGAWILLSLKPGSATAATADLLGECTQLMQKAGLRP
jgi:ribonuclease P protein component